MANNKILGTILVMVLGLIWTVSLAMAGENDTKAQETKNATTDLRRTVDVYLSGIEKSTSFRAWKELGDRALPILREIIKDKNEPPFKRARAIYALGAFGQRAENFKLLSSIAKKEKAIPTIRRAAVKTLIFVWKDAALPIIEPLIPKADPLLKEAIAQQLIYVKKNPKAKRILLKFKKDKSQIVRQAAEQSLNYLNDSNTK